MRAGRRAVRDRLARKKRQAAWRRAVVAGVCAVALGTTYALILPGVTLEESLAGEAVAEERQEAAPEEAPQAAEAEPAVEVAEPAKSAAPVASPEPERREAAEAAETSEPPVQETASPQAAEATAPSEAPSETETVTAQETAPEAAPAAEDAETSEAPSETETAPAQETAPEATETSEPPSEAETAPTQEAIPEATETSEPSTQETASPQAAEASPAETGELDDPEVVWEAALPLAVGEAPLENAVALAAEEDGDLIAKTCQRTDDTLNYTLTINPNAQNLAAGQLRVVDTLSYNVALSSSVTARLTHGSVKAYRLYPNGDAVALDTSAYRYGYEETSEQKTVFLVRRQYYTDTLTIDIPDDTAVRIDYQYNLYGTAGVDWNMREFTNEAKLLDGGTGEYLPNASAQVSQGTVKVVGQSTDPDTAVVIHTVDSDDHDVNVSNETFALWKYSGGGYVSQGDFTTDDQGVYTLTDLEHYTAYYVVKGKAPPGYAGDDIPVYFYINCGFSHSQVLPDDTSGFHVISPQGHIDLTYTRDHAKVTVKANWRDPEGNPGVPSLDTLEFELLQSAVNDGGTAVGDPVSVGRFQLAQDDWVWSSETLSDFLPASGEKDGQSVRYSYAIREDLSIPGHYVTYAASLDAIIVTIRQTYELPGTGGSGPGGLLAAGLTLAAGAGYLLYRQRKRKGGLDPP